MAAPTSLGDSKSAALDASSTLPALEQTSKQPHKVDAGPQQQQQRVILDSNGFLAAPAGPGLLRPLSPDTLSNFSFDEYEQLRPVAPPIHPSHSTEHDPSLIPLHSSGFKSRLQSFWQHNLGLVYMLLSQFFGVLMNVTTRTLETSGNSGAGFHPFQILFVRMGITFLIASAYMSYTKTPHFPFGAPGIRWLLVARGFGGFFGVFGMYYSLLYLPLADATVITFLIPSLACWACSIVINEPFTKVERWGGVVSLMGVVLIARPTSLFASSDATSNTGAAVGAEGGAAVAVGDFDFEGVTPLQRLGAVGVALLGVLGGATAFTMLRWIGKRAHPLISVNYFAGFSFVVSIVAQIAVPSIGFLIPRDLRDWGLLLFLGTCGFIMQYLLVRGLTFEKSSRTTNMFYTQMLFALGADKLVFGHTPSGLSIVGSSLILGSAIVVALQKTAATTSTSGELADGGDVVMRERMRDEESRVGLLSGGGEGGGEVGEEDGDAAVREGVELRPLR